MMTKAATSLAAVTTVSDLERSPLGLAGSPLTELLGEPVIRHVVRNACEVRGIQDEFYGDRVGAVSDPAGNQWWIATRKETLTSEEIAERLSEDGGS